MKEDYKRLFAQSQNAWAKLINFDREIKLTDAGKIARL